METTNKKTCVLAEELGHHYTTTGNILEQEIFGSDYSVFVKDHDLKKLLLAADGHRLELLIVLAINTGCRIGEMLALTYADIKDGVLYISKQLSEAPKADGRNCPPYIDTPKTNSSIRAIPLTTATLEQVERHMAWQRLEMMEKGYRTEYLFTTKAGAWYRRRNVKKSLDRLYDREGLPHHKVLIGSVKQLRN